VVERFVHTEEVAGSIPASPIPPSNPVHKIQLSEHNNRMSLDKSVAINCPKCEHVQSVTVWTSLNAQVSPQAKKDFFEGKINVFHCEVCGHSASLETDFMYHDMELQFCVQYYPPTFFEAREFGKSIIPTAL
jgi:transcription elongation factor Elf1